jgi:hypothetical protein
LLRISLNVRKRLYESRFGPEGGTLARLFSLSSAPPSDSEDSESSLVPIDSSPSSETITLGETEGTTCSGSV